MLKGRLYMKKFLSLALMTIFVLISSTTAFAAGTKKEDNLKLNCKAGLVMEFNTGKIVYEFNSHEKLPPASVTKIMTMLLTMEAVDSGKIKLSDKVTISARSKSMGGSTMYLETGELRTVEELLKGVAIESANDAAIALAEYIGGTEEAFVDKMNERAKELGMKDTHFVNSYGFHDPNHYTSAHDIAIMSRELLKHSRILNYTTIWMETISEGRKEPFTLVNRNKMIKAYDGCDGLKTGYTKEAMYCISATAKKGDMRFISVIIGAPSWKERNEMAARLLDYGFSKYESVKVVKKGEVIDEIALPKAKPEKVKVTAKDDLSVIFERGNKAKIDKKVEIFKDVKLPLKKGDNVGIIKAVEGDKVYGKVDLIVEQDVNRINLSDTVKMSFKLWLKMK
jgi:D-alanyl-D-alanine carboxypeptidase (penicillin-binding protein 5/6)